MYATAAMARLRAVDRLRRSSRLAQNRTFTGGLRTMALEDIFNTLKTDGAKPRLCELGKIKIGGLGEARQKQGGGTWRLPRKDDHFTITTLYRDARGDLLPDKELMDQLLDEFGDD